MTEAEYPTKDTPYLTLAGELWGVFCDDSRENWPCYDGTTLYRCCLTSMRIPIIKIKQCDYCLIFIMRIYLHGITVFILKQGPDSVLMFQTPVLVAGQPASMDKPEEKGLAEEKEAEIDIKEQFDLDQMPMQLQLLHSFLMVSTHAWHGSASSSIWFSTSLWGWVRCWDRWMCVAARWLCYT